MATFRSRQAERRHLATVMRAEGRTWVEIAQDFRDRYSVNARKAIRFAHGWSQAEVAERWNIFWPDDPKTEDNIGAWERWPESGYEPSLAVLDRLAELYECDVADLVADRASFRHMDRARRDPVPSGPSSLPGVEAIELRRRLEVSDVGPATIAAITDGVDELASSYARQAPASLMPLLQTYQRYVAGLLEGRCTLKQRKDIMRQAGWLSVLAATAWIDVGNTTAAMANFDAARRLAAETDDHALAAWSYETQAWHHTSLGNPAAAATLCEAGLKIAPVGSSAHVLLHTQAARVAARLGDARRTHQMVDDALAALERVPAAEHSDSHFGCSERRVVSHCAAALVWLGDRSDAAEASVRQAISAYESGESDVVHHLAVARINLALLFAGRGEPTEAAALGHQALDAAWRLCHTDLFLVGDLDRRLAGPYHRVHEVTAFHDRFLSVSSEIERRAIPAVANAENNGG